MVLSPLLNSDPTSSNLPSVTLFARLAQGRCRQGSRSPTDRLSEAIKVALYRAHRALSHGSCSRFGGRSNREIEEATQYGDRNKTPIPNFLETEEGRAVPTLLMV